MTVPRTKQNPKVSELSEIMGNFFLWARTILQSFNINRVGEVAGVQKTKKVAVTSQKCFLLPLFFLYSIDYYTVFRYFHMKFNFLFVKPILFQMSKQIRGTLLFFFFFLILCGGEGEGSCRGNYPQLGVCLQGLVLV